MIGSATLLSFDSNSHQVQVSGNLSLTTNQVDLYAVQVPQGERVDAEVSAESLGSGLDSIWVRLRRCCSPVGPQR